MEKLTKNIHSGLPVWADKPLRTSRRGHFWINGERLKIDNKTYQHGPMYVFWEVPEKITKIYPVILVHGGTLQGTEWMDTPDGRPGWAQRFLENGYPVFIVDRPGHGRSPYHSDIIGQMGPAFSYERGQEVYFPSDDADIQTQWPFSPLDHDAYDSFIAPYGPMPADLAKSQDMDARRISQLLDRIGPAILVTHSASGPDGWLVADRRPGLVKAIVSVEPMGPVFGTTPGIGSLSWGITSAPLTYDPPRLSVEDVKLASPESLRIPAFLDVPIALVTGETSVFANYAPEIVKFLINAGAKAEELHLPDFGIQGNGHGLIYELNSDQTLQPVLDWLVKKIPDQEITGITTDAGNEDPRKCTILVIYEGTPGARFDRKYYRSKHIPMLDVAWAKYGLEKVEDLYPPEEGDIIAMAVCTFRNKTAAETAFNSPESKAVMLDIINYTDITPLRITV
ncbi:EthD family reductase [Pedobacter sp. 22163]|uniref:EthD family reductase n=1 Tax=Pedobacter sp. 22163 TaxID=3453883 RepID=UPI003F829107